MTALVTGPTRRTRSSSSQSSWPTRPAGPPSGFIGVATCPLIRGRIVAPATAGGRVLAALTDRAGAGRRVRARRLIRCLVGHPLRAALLPAALQRRHGSADLARA